MNRKLEDKLVDLAFGELTPEDAVRVEAATARDHQAAHLLSAYRDLKGDLKLLADIPEPQISTDRLRDAILSSGLQQAPKETPANSRRWLWMPAGACVLAFAAVMLRGQFAQSGEPHLVGLDSVASRVSLPEPQPFSAMTKSVDRIQAKIVATQTQAKQEPIVAATTRRQRRHHVRGYLASRMNNAADKSPSNETLVIKAPPIDGGAALNASNEYAMENKSDKTSSSGPIVLIADDKDAGTGTQLATEVQSASNVLVGG